MIGGGDDGLNEDVEMANVTDTEEVPMMHLASFALHKLFTEWQNEGFEIPDFRLNYLPTGAAQPERKPVPEKSVLPPNAATMHPSMLLSVMRPASTYIPLGTEGVTPSIVHRMGITLNGQQFIGAARSKKLARKAAAIEACNALFGMSFTHDETDLSSNGNAAAVAATNE